MRLLALDGVAVVEGDGYRVSLAQVIRAGDEWVAEMRRIAEEVRTLDG